MRLVLVLVLLATLAATGCKKQEERDRSAPPRSAATAADGTATTVATTLAAPTPLPAATAAGLGRPAPVTLHTAAHDGAWVALCQADGTVARPWLVVGDRAGLAVDRVVASSDHDVLFASRGRLFHVDVAARTSRDLGPTAHGAVDPGSRRVVFARGTRLVILDPGKAPREIETGAPVATVWLHGQRWADVGSGEVPEALRRPDCGPLYLSSGNDDARTTVDLDPSGGVEAADRVGPEVSITPAGEVTLDGEVVLDTACVGNVIAALASPPRVLVVCKSGTNVVAGTAGFRVDVHHYTGANTTEQATIARHMVLAQRLVCLSSACVDLLTGASYHTGISLVAANGGVLVRKLDDGGLQIDHLPATLDGAGRQQIVKLPRVTQAVTVDTVTGRRRTGAAPVPAAFIDAAGRWMLYGRHVIDLEDGVLVTTLAEDALAIDHIGRVLVPAAPGVGPLQWKKP